MKKTEIGVSTIEYNIDGTVKNADFKATMELQIPIGILSELIKKNVSTSAEDVEQVKLHSDIVLSSYFARMNDIELRDFEATDLVGERQECKFFTNGKVMKCVIKYYFVER